MTLTHPGTALTQVDVVQGPDAAFLAEARLDPAKACRCRAENRTTPPSEQTARTIAALVLVPLLDCISTSVAVLFVHGQVCVSEQ